MLYGEDQLKAAADEYERLVMRFGIDHKAALVDVLKSETAAEEYVGKHDGIYRDALIAWCLDWAAGQTREGAGNACQ